MKAIIFPGQGAQYIGMGKSLYDNSNQAKEIFDKIDSILGFSLSKKCFEGSAEELKETSLQQLSILTVSLSAYQAFKEKNVKIDYFAGLSLGEYTCLYASEVLSLPDLVKLVKERALAMQEASRINPSCMLAIIGAEKEIIERFSKEKKIYLANFNSPKQIVISLKEEDKEDIKKFFEEKNIRAIELEVSGGFHSPFMEPAKLRLEKILNEMVFKEAKIPIVSNVDALPYIEGEKIRNNLLNQLTSPVLWWQSVEFMIKKGVDVFFEIGPSKILRGLMRKINPSVKVINIEKYEDLLSF
jgi:[acyl-carrier-protein] S-malonyltransferase